MTFEKAHLSLNFVPDFGAWESKDELLCLRSTCAPWHSLFSDLDSVSRGEFDSSSVSILEEAEAIVACCLRYGSFFSALCQGERWKGKKGQDVSLVTDEEMMRINIEFSAGVAQWFADGESNRQRIVRRVRATHNHLDMNWGTKASGRDRFQFLCYGDKSGADDPVRIEFGRKVLSGLDELAEKVGGREALRDSLHVPQVYTFRQEANYLVNKCYRNGPIESLHAGKSNEITGIYGYRRFSNPELREVCNSAVLKLCNQLIYREDFDRETLNIMRCADFFNKPYAWSETEETTPTTYNKRL